MYNKKIDQFLLDKNLSPEKVKDWYREHVLYFDMIADFLKEMGVSIDQIVFQGDMWGLELSTNEVNSILRNKIMLKLKNTEKNIMFVLLDEFNGVAKKRDLINYIVSNSNVETERAVFSNLNKLKKLNVIREKTNLRLIYLNYNKFMEEKNNELEK